MPVLVCYESTAKISAGESYCHRHLVAAWLGPQLFLRHRHMALTAGSLGRKQPLAQLARDIVDAEFLRGNPPQLRVSTAQP